MVKPALTAEEWKLHRMGVGDTAYSELFVYGRRLSPLERHKLAAQCLDRQPFGFTQEDVAMLRDIAEAIEAALGAKIPAVVTVSGPAGRALMGAYAGECRDLADRIEVLLPVYPS